MADKTATIEFDEYPGKGFVVRLSPVPLEDYFDISERLGNLRGADAVRELIARFDEVAFIGMEGDDDTPLARNDLNVVLALVGQWAKAVAQVPLPLPARPGAGGPSKARRASKSRRR